MAETVHDRLLDLLRNDGVQFRLMEHEPVTTSADAARVRGVGLQTGAKAMIVKAGEEFVLAVLAADRMIDWKKLRVVLGTRKVRLADEDEVATLCELPKGAIPPIGRLIGVDTFVDASLLETDVVRFNAGSLTKSVEMRRDDLVAVAQARIETFSS